MKAVDINRPLTAKALNENLYKQFNIRVDLDKYTREQLENYRNLLRTKVHSIESQANFNDLLTNETYQQNKFVLGILNTRIKEMIGESKVVSEKAVSKAQQQAAGAALAAKRAGKTPKKGPSAAMAKMSTKELKKFAGTKHQGLPKHKKTKEAMEPWMRKPEDKDFDVPAFQRKEKWEKDLTKAVGPKAVRTVKNSKTDEEIKTGKKEFPVKEAIKTKKKPDADKDGVPDWADKKPGKDDNAGKKTGKKGMSAKQAKFFGKKKKKTVKEQELIHRAYQKFISEGIAHYIAEDEEGKAKAITAASDMVNDFTSWMQRVGNYQTKSMIELADNIRSNFGMQESETFKQAVGSALEGALAALTTAREEINNAVAVLAGEAPPQQAMGSEPKPNLDMDVTEPDQMNPLAGDEFAASDAAAGGPETLGRMRRESIERGNRLMKILGS